MWLAQNSTASRSSSHSNGINFFFKDSGVTPRSFPRSQLPLSLAITVLKYGNFLKKLKAFHVRQRAADQQGS